MVVLKMFILQYPSRIKVYMKDRLANANFAIAFIVWVNIKYSNVFIYNPQCNIPSFNTEHVIRITSMYMYVHMSYGFM